MGPISKVVAKIKDMTGTLLKRVQADIGLSKQTADSFLEHLPTHLLEEIQQELAQEDVGTTSPTPR